MDKVTLVIPTFNEQYYIKKVITSILSQDYDFNNIEVIFIDGNSKDSTVDIINGELKDRKIDYKIIINQDRITPKSVNMGIKAAKYDIIMRLDAHSEYPSTYISKCIYYLNKTGADNVGCLLFTKGEGIIGQAIASVVSTKFGVGNSSFRVGAKSGYVDTVPYGTFRKSLFEKIGYFNEELLRTEDNEFNYRIRKNGGKVYLFNDIQVIYHPRNSILKLVKMAYQNGEGVIYTNYFLPGSMGIRHLVPLIFVISILIGILGLLLNIQILKILFIIEIVLYFSLDLIFSLKTSLLCLILYPLYHILYGIGSIFGVFKIWKKNYTVLKKKN